MSAWERTRRQCAFLAVAALGVGAGFVASSRPWDKPLSQVPAAVAHKPTRGLLSTGCSLYDRYGYHKDEGCPVEPGKGLRVGFYTIDAGWAITMGPDGWQTTLTVRNANPGSIGRFWQTLHLERYDGGLVEILWCETAGVFTAGQSQHVVCKPLSPSDPDERVPFDSVAIS